MTARIAYQRVAPEAVKAVGAINQYLENCGIDHKLRALIDLRVSQINGCAYCCDMHSNQARAAGERQHRLDCLPAWRETTFYDDRERAALAWAESVTLVAETGIPDGPFEELKKHFNEKEIVDLTVIVAMINTWNRISIAFRNQPPLRHDTSGAKA
jgi:AhpD family alkylhydroperoxidase